MKPNKKLQKQKTARKISHEISELRKKVVYNPPTIKLKEKIFAGYWRFFEVRADVLKSSIGNDIQRIVDACNHWAFSRCKTKKEWNREIYSDSITGNVPLQKLYPLNEKEWAEYNFPKRIQRYFHPVTYTRSYGTKTVTWMRYFPDIPEHMLQWGYKKGYYTEENILDTDGLSKLAYDEKWMEDNNGWELLKEQYRDDWTVNLKKKHVTDKLKKKEIDEYFKEE